MATQVFNHGRARAHTARQQKFEIIDVARGSATVVEKRCDLVIGECLLVIHAHIDTRQSAIRYLDRYLEYVAEIRSTSARHFDREV